MPPTLLSKTSLVQKPWMPRAAKELPAADFIADHIVTRPITKPGDLVLCLRAKTGAGKSTVLPPKLYQRIYESSNSPVPRGMIIVTQPRVLTAVDIVSQITQFNPFLKRGENLGYSTGSQKLLVRRGVLFSTVGTLLRQLKVMDDEWICRRYSVILVDEVHERSIETDLTLFYLKGLLERNWESRACPRVVLMSATFEPSPLQKYFSAETPQSFMDVEGISFPREIHWLSEVTPDFLQKAASTVREIHESGTADEPPFTDVLVFAKGGKDIKEIVTAVAAMNTDQQLIDNAGALSPVELTRITYGSAGASYRSLFTPIELVKEEALGKMVSVKRRVFVSTNIAETGVTIDSLRYCVDTGFLFSVNYNPDFDCTVLMAAPVTQGESLQRRGRIGRKAPGVYYALYPESVFEKMDPERAPIILSSDICDAVMAAVIEGEKTGPFDPSKSLDFMTPPSATSLCAALEKMFLLGFVDEELRSTPMGRVFGSVTKMRPETVRMLLSAFDTGASMFDLATVGAFAELGWREVFTSRKYQHKFLDIGVSGGRDAARCLWGCDFIEGLWAWYMFVEQVDSCRTKTKCLQEWCKQNSISYSGMLNLVAKRNEIIESLIFAKVHVFSHKINLLEAARKNLDLCVKEVMKIKRSIYEGFRANCATWNPKEKKYVADLTGAPLEFVESPFLKKIQSFRRPRRVLASDVGIFPNPFNPQMYAFSAGLIMILDQMPFDDEGFCTEWP